MKKEQRARFKELKRKAKNNGFETVEEIEELAELYKLSATDYMVITLVLQGMGLLFLIASIIMRLI